MIINNLIGIRCPLIGLGFLALLLTARLVAQERPVFHQLKKEYELLPPKSLYRFPAFTEGTAVMRNGIIVSQLFNYNVSQGEMDFINEKGDTLSFADPAGISFISLHGSRFYYSRGYLQTIDTADGMSLAYRQWLMALQHKTAKGDKLPRLDKEDDRFFTGNGRAYNSKATDRLIITAREEYFFGKADGRFSKASKAVVLEYFSRHDNVMKTYLNRHPVNFSNPEDLKRLMKFCRQL